MLFIIRDGKTVKSKHKLSQYKVLKTSNQFLKIFLSEFSCFRNKIHENLKKKSELNIILI
jgi:hypothetical protein